MPIKINPLQEVDLETVLDEYNLTLIVEEHEENFWTAYIPDSGIDAIYGNCAEAAIKCFKEKIQGKTFSIPNKVSSKKYTFPQKLKYNPS